jgi:hypothetical protein
MAKINKFKQNETSFKTESFYSLINYRIVIETKLYAIYKL